MFKHRVMLGVMAFMVAAMGCLHGINATERIFTIPDTLAVTNLEGGFPDDITYVSLDMTRLNEDDSYLEVDSLIINIDANLTSADMVIMEANIYDCENLTEGYWFLNSQTTGRDMAEDGRTGNAEWAVHRYILDKSLLIQGNNTIRWTHHMTHGYLIKEFTITVIWADTPMFTAAGHKTVRSGFPLAFKIPYCDPLQGTVTFTYLDQPEWLDYAHGDSIGGVPKGIDVGVPCSTRVILNVNGKEYDTLNIKITVEELNMSVDGNKITIVGSPIGLKIVYDDPPGENDSLTFEDLPDFLTVQDDSIYGTPTDLDAGMHNVKIFLSDYAYTDCQIIVDELIGIEPFSQPFALPANNLSVSSLLRPVISFGVSLEEQDDFRIEVFSAGGQKVWTYHADKAEAGYHRIGWDLSLSESRIVNGIYWVILKSTGKQVSRRFMIIR